MLLEMVNQCQTCKGTGRNIIDVSAQLECFTCDGHGREFHELTTGDLCLEKQSRVPFLYIGHGIDGFWFLESGKVSDKVSKCFGAHIVRSMFMIVSRFDEAA